MEEIWKDIPGYEDRYQVSNLGRIKSFLRIGVRSTVKKIDENSHFIKPVHDACGYCQVRLRKNDKGTTRKVHRLVADAFIPNPTGLKEINHKDENKDNNRVDNLEWCDRNYNIHYGTWVSRNPRLRPVNQYSLNGVFIRRYDSIREASRATGIRHENIRSCAAKQIINKERGYYIKSAGGYKWEFADLGFNARKED